MLFTYLVLQVIMGGACSTNGKNAKVTVELGINGKVMRQK
jgi:hypothetical protein